jgi:hypothetical protein
MTTFPSKVLIAGTIRDGAHAIEESVQKIEAAFVAIPEVKWLVIESDSSDDTLSVLKNISERNQNFKYKSLGILSERYPARTDRIARARNEYLRLFQDSSEFSDFTHLVVADLDGVNNLLTREGVTSTFELSKESVVTANQLGPYYDIWALRHEFWSPNDCWKELEFFKRRVQWPERALEKSVLSRMITIDTEEEPIEVLSAFGGLAIYPRDSVRNLEYCGLNEYGEEVCEHVQFSEGVRQNGFKILINPKMTNIDFTDFSVEKKSRRKLLRILKYPFKYFEYKFGK